MKWFLRESRENGKPAFKNSNFILISERKFTSFRYYWNKLKILIDPSVNLTMHGSNKAVNNNNNPIRLSICLSTGSTKADKPEKDNHANNSFS